MRRSYARPGGMLEAMTPAPTAIRIAATRSPRDGRARPHPVGSSTPCRLTPCSPAFSASIAGERRCSELRWAWGNRARKKPRCGLSEPADWRALLRDRGRQGVQRPRSRRSRRFSPTDHAHERANGHRCVTAWRDETPIGFVYGLGADDQPQLVSLWIAVATISSPRLGRTLLAFCEAEVRRVAVGAADRHWCAAGYAPTRRFYAKRLRAPP